MKITDDPFYRGLMGTVFSGPAAWTVADRIIAGLGTDYKPAFYTEEERAWAYRIMGKPRRNRSG